MKNLIIATVMLVAFAFTAQARNNVTSQKATTVYNVKTIPAGTDNAKLLQTIAAAYKGKVVLIDFWATWCGPCRNAMKEIDPLKEELKNVSYVYITGESSPKATWDEMIKGISGDHYRLSGSQWNFLSKELDMIGIPCYMILKKDGTISYSNVTTGGYPGNDIMRSELQKAMK